MLIIPTSANPTNRALEIVSCQDKLAELISLRRQHRPLLDHPDDSSSETPSIDATIAKAWADLQAAKPSLERNKIRTRRRRQQPRNGVSEYGRLGQASIITFGSSSTASDSGYFPSTHHHDDQHFAGEEEPTPGKNSPSPLGYQGLAASYGGRVKYKNKLDLTRRIQWKLLDRNQYGILEKKIERNDIEVRDKIGRIEQMVRLGPLEALLEKTVRDEEKKRAEEVERLRLERDAKGLALLEPPVQVSMKGVGTTTTIVQVQVLQVQVGAGGAAAVTGEGVT